jgi:hypothetical protein
MKAISSFVKRNLLSILLFILLIVTFLLWLPTRSIPYWWDSSQFVVQAARQYIATNFWPLTPGYTDIGHPPLFVLSLAFLWKVFGESLLLSHLYNLFFVLLTVIYTFLIGKQLIKNNPILGGVIGFCCALLLLFTPVFVAQMGIIYMEIPVTAFALMTYYYFVTKKTLRYIFAATLMVLTKELSVVLILFFVLISFFNTPKKQRFKQLSFLVVPLVFLFVWYVYHKFATGWLFILPGRKTANSITSLSLDVKYLAFTAQFIFLEQGRYILFLLIVALLLVFFMQKGTFKKYILYWDLHKILFVVLPITFTIIFTKSEFLLRYCIIVLPFLYFFFYYNFYILLRLLKSTQKIMYISFLLFTGFLLLFFYSGWDTHRQITSWYYQPLEDNLEYLNIIELGKISANYIQKNYLNKRIYVSFPLHFMYNQPFQHYVDKPIKTFECSTYKKGDKVDVIMLHTYAPGEWDCYKLAEKLGTEHEVVFKINGKQFTLVTPKHN